ncbi:MAG TPA: nucleoside-diphosphate sugar epimerase/dehydratase [Balneolaceae bacterium]|nr:nucleoside-diphosphate sugar epimerase/dehydratase [Balneolaceae bacterium]
MNILPTSYKQKYQNRFTRGLFFLAGDAVALVFSAEIAYLILSPLVKNSRPFPTTDTFIITGSVLFGLAMFRMYLVSWKYTSLKDLIRLIMGVLAGGGLSMIIAPLFLVIGTYEYVFTGLVIMIAILAIGGFRIAKRLYLGLLQTSGHEQKHTIIFGADSEGEQILRDILLHNNWGLTVHAIFDDRAMVGLRLHGVKVLGGKKRMMTYLQNKSVDQLIVAFPQYPKKDLKAIIEKAKELCPEINIKILPSFHSLTDNPVGFRHIRDVQIEDILGRKPVEIDFKSIKKSIAGKVILVTGAGGSIGSELIQQCASLQPSQLIALDIDETELFHLENEFKGQDVEVTPCVASITDEDKMGKILSQYEPEVIFHAAAYKHVPMMEIFPEEAIKVNIGGTLLLASLACKHEVDKFVMVSTDKAVNPTNVMGATKRVAEEICMAQNEMGTTRFVSVRFGNVLGSRGSVVPLFIEQIKDGGPVTVTDPDMKRYFMTIPEAVLLVMQAGAMGEGGEVFVLDMGTPVKILDMAEDLIRLHNLEPGKDIDIKFTGIRPGEKLFEELLNVEEGKVETEHSEISKAICSRKLDVEDLDQKIADMFDILKTAKTGEIRYHLKSMVPTYSYKKNGKIKDQLNNTTVAK